MGRAVGKKNTMDEIRNGDYFFDKKNGVLILYYQGCINISSSQLQGTNIACDIALNEDILCDVLGFTSDGSGGYINGTHHISFRKDNFLEYNGKSIHTLNDLKHAYEDDGEILHIDVSKLCQKLNKTTTQVII